MATQKKTAAKKAPAKKAATPVVEVSKITTAASKAIQKNPKQAAKAAAMAVISELVTRAGNDAALVRFLKAALKEVKGGGGQDGGGTANPSGPPNIERTD